MSTSVDYIPRNDSAFLNWVKFLIAFVKTNAEQWQIPATSWTNVDYKIWDFTVALEKMQNPNHGKADTEQKNHARGVLEPLIRQYVKEYLEYNHLISDDDRERMGLPVHDKKPTPVPTPTTTVEMDAKAASPGVIKIAYQDSASGKKAKPHGVHGAEFNWAILDHVPTDWTELIHSSFSTHSPAVLSFEGHQRGQTFYFASRWENTRGEKGPWSEIQSVIIP
ncbi:MAG: hypothetical protein LBE71_04475 [Dysgonamonadaceae bacterium]|jgi:hypothetical protein|nr:hypothetical protein [Dysgonamonadaceae bacterium]